MFVLLLARLEAPARPDPPARREVQDRLALQAIVDPPAQLGARGSRGIRVKEVKEAILASKVLVVFPGCQVLPELSSSSQVFLGRMGATVIQDLQGLRDRTAKHHSLGPQDVRGRPAQKATPGVQL